MCIIANSKVHILCSTFFCLNWSYSLGITPFIWLLGSTCLPNQDWPISLRGFSLSSLSSNTSGYFDFLLQYTIISVLQSYINLDQYSPSKIKPFLSIFNSSSLGLLNLVNLYITFIYKQNIYFSYSSFSLVCYD